MNDVFSFPVGLVTTIGSFAYQRERSYFSRLFSSIVYGAGTGIAFDLASPMIKFKKGNWAELIPSFDITINISSYIAPMAALAGAAGNIYYIKQLTKYNDISRLEKLCKGEIPRDSKSDFIYTAAAYFPIAALSFLTSWTYAPIIACSVFASAALLCFKSQAEGGLANKFDSDTLGYLALGASTLLAYSYTPLTTVASTFSSAGMLLTAALSAGTAYFLRSKISNLKESSSEFLENLEIQKQICKSEMNDLDTAVALKTALGRDKSMIYRHMNAAIKPEIISIENDLVRNIASQFLLLKICQKGKIPTNQFIEGFEGLNKTTIQMLQDLMEITPSMTNSQQIANFCNNISASYAQELDPKYVENVLKYICKRVNEKAKEISKQP